jgi:hypothetical protein
MRKELAMSKPKPCVDIEPFAVRPKDGTRLAGCGETEFYKRLNSGRYESFLDGTSRLVTVRSIRADQEKLLAASKGTPRAQPSKRRGGPGRPRKVT